MFQFKLKTLLWGLTSICLALWFLRCGYRIQQMECNLNEANTAIESRLKQERRKLDVQLDQINVLQRTTGIMVSELQILQGQVSDLQDRLKKVEEK